MLEEEKEEKKNYAKYIIIIIILFFVLIIAGGINVASRIYGGIKNPSEIAKNYFEKITNNYSLDIKLNKGEEEYTLNYMSDGVVEMYTSDTFPKIGYLTYNSSYYCFDDNKFKNISSININTIFNDKLYNINFIKKLLEDCDFEVTSLIRAKCILNTDKFFEEYNNFYDENIAIRENEMVPIEVIFDSTRIRNIKIIYDNVVKILDQSSENVEYDIEISDINKNDFSEFIPYLEKKN